LKYSFANKCLLTALAIFMALNSIIFTAGCGKSLTTLQGVLKESPVVISIVNTGVDLYNATDPEGADAQLKITVDAFVAEGTRDLTELVALIQSYQSDISAAPSGTLQKADALVASIQAQQAALVAAFRVKSPRAQAEAAAIVDGVQSFLAQLALFLPPSAQKQAPSAVAVVKTQSAVVGPVKVITPRQLAQRFNDASAKNFPQIRVAVPK
jgi:Skp family chaperone for outer membrane proteins